MTCASCGASNTLDAAWCTQCHSKFDQAVKPTKGWPCRTCNELNALADSLCATCGAPIYDSFGERQQFILTSEAIRASAVPGLGQARVGKRVEGGLTAVLVVFSLVAGLFIVLARNVGGWVLVGAGLALWALSARDAYVVAARTDGAWLGARTISVAAGAIMIVAAILVLRSSLISAL